MIFLRLLSYFLLIVCLPNIVTAQSGKTGVLSNTQSADTAEKLPSVEESIKKTKDYSLQLNEINKMLATPLDTSEIMQVLPAVEEIVEALEDRLKNANDNINLRYLKSLDNLLSSINSQNQVIEKTIATRTADLVAGRDKIEVIKNDQLFLRNWTDATLLAEYRTSIAALKQNVLLTDSTLNSQRLHAASLQARTAILTSKTLDISTRLRLQKRKLEKELLKKENNYLWEPATGQSTKKLWLVVKEALNLNQIILTRYLLLNTGKSALLLLFAVALYFWVRKNLRTIRKEKEYAKIILGRTRYVPQFPLLASLLIVAAISPLFYANPPTVFFSMIIIAMVTITGIMLLSKLSKSLFAIWLGGFTLFLLSAVSNLYWEVAFQERWFLLALGLAGIFLSYRVIRLNAKGIEELPTYVVSVAGAFIMFHSIALIFNILGRFSLGKIIGITSTMSIMHAFGLLVFVIVAKEFIYLQLEVSRKNQKDITSYIDFAGVQKRVKRIFTYLAVVIWLYYFLENLSALDYLLDFFGSFLSKPRTILSATFSFGGIVVFFTVIYVSYILANNIAYFAAINDAQHTDARNKRLGSSTLLIRLGIFTIGFIIAVAISGMPLDKVAIVLGALSVGIGFGLQGIVNNVVSGIILAFERPIQIGDTVRIGTTEGVVTQIGVRASHIRNWDGAEVVIPNGDVLAQSLTNWTLTDKTRRTELLIGVGLNSDAEQVSAIIHQQLDLAKDILEKPAKMVYLQTIGERSLDFRVLFWVKDFETWLPMRDEAMRLILKGLKENGIEIPFPQRDLHIKSMPGRWVDGEQAKDGAA